MRRSTDERRQGQLSVTGLIAAKLKKIGASKIPSQARELIEADIMAACAALVEKRVTAPYIGKVVARALAASATTPEGSKGELRSPLASSALERSEQGRVAGLTDATQNNQKAIKPKGAS